MNKKIVIHIGTPKTGSKTLQTFLSSDELQNTDISYPKTSYIGNENGSFLLLNKNDRYFKKCIEKIRLELKKKNLIFLSEEILSFHFVYNDVPYHYKNAFISPANIKENFLYLIKKFKNIDIEFLIYLRRQDDYIESEFKQTLMDYGFNANNQSTSFNDLFKEYIKTKEKMLNYNSWINELGNLVGKNKVRIKSFEYASKFGLINDLVQAYNIDISKDTISKYDKVIHKSHSYIYLYAVNSLYKNVSSELLRNFVYGFSYLDKFETSTLFSNKYRSNFLLKYSDCNKQVNKLYSKNVNNNIFPPLKEKKLPLFNESDSRINEILISFFEEFVKVQSNNLRKIYDKKPFKIRLKQKVKTIIKKYLRILNFIGKKQG